MIDSATGEITAKQNVGLGYSDTVCVECENTLGSKVTAIWTVKQGVSCAAALTANTLEDKSYPFDASKTSVVVATVSDGFTNNLALTD